MNRIGNIATCAGLLAMAAGQPALSAQKRPSGRPSSGKAIPFLPSNAVAIDTICNPKLRPKTTLRVRIKKDFSTIEDDDGIFRRLVFYKNYPAGTDPNEPDDDVVAGEVPNVGSTAEFNDNPFHIDLSTLSNADPAWIRVRIVLNNEKFMFDKPLDRAGHVILGVSRDANDAETADWFCQMPDVAAPSPLPTPRPEPRPIDTNKRNKSVLTFYIHRKSGGRMGSINLHVIAIGQKGGKTPIIIDPRIKNEG